MDVLGKPLSAFAQEGAYDKLLAQPRAGQRVASHPTPMQHNSGKEMEVYISMECIEDEGGEPVGCSMTVAELLSG